MISTNGSITTTMNAPIRAKSVKGEPPCRPWRKAKPSGGEKASAAKVGGSIGAGILAPDEASAA